MKQEAKLVYLLECLQKTAPPVLIFAEKQTDVDDVHEYLMSKDVDAVAVHGQKTQEERAEAIDQFKVCAMPCCAYDAAERRCILSVHNSMPLVNCLKDVCPHFHRFCKGYPGGNADDVSCTQAGKADVLVATDVASKGLDFPDIQHVINFDMPSEIENYVHRIGRTGRCGKTGIATSFINKNQSESILLDLKHLLKEAKQRIPPVLMVRRSCAALLLLHCSATRACPACDVELFPE